MYVIILYFLISQLAIWKVTLFSLISPRLLPNGRYSCRRLEQVTFSRKLLIKLLCIFTPFLSICFHLLFGFHWEFLQFFPQIKEKILTFFRKIFMLFFLSHSRKVNLIIKISCLWIISMACMKSHSWDYIEASDFNNFLLPIYHYQTRPHNWTTEQLYGEVIIFCFPKTGILIILEV